MSETYRVVIKGIREGVSKDQTIRNLATLFQSTEERILVKFEAPTFLVKKGLDLQSTEKYISVVEKQGCICAIESESDLVAPIAPNEHLSPKKEQIYTDPFSKTDTINIGIQDVVQDTEIPPEQVTHPEWYYELRSSRLGPVSTEELRKLISDGKLLLGSHVWKKGLDDWIDITSPIIWKA